MKKVLYSLFTLPLALAACTPTQPQPPANTTPKLAALKSAFALDTGNLNEFADVGCNTDQTPDKPWGDDNFLNKFCVAADADFVYLGSSTRVGNGNSVIHYIALDNGSAAREMLKLDAWRRHVTFDPTVPGPNYFLANFERSTTPNFRKIETVSPTAITTSEPALPANSVKVTVDGLNVLTKAKVPRAALGAFDKAHFAVVLVGNDDYGGGVILPNTGNTIKNSDAEKFAITLKKILTFVK